MPRPSGTQTRTFVHNGKLLEKATNPENGTGHLHVQQLQQSRDEDRHQGEATVYTYDTYARLTKVQRYPTGTSGS